VIHRHRDQYPIALMCRVLRVTRSGYYAWRSRPASARQQRDNQLRVVIRAIFSENQKRYGSVRIHRELRQRQERVSRKRVARLMVEERLRARRSRRYRALSATERLGPAPHLLQRRFLAPRPNEYWVSDVTACPTRQGWLYLAVVLDLFSRRVVGWAAGASPGQELTVPALRMALRRRSPAAGLLHHSDRGMHYSGSVYQRVLADNQITASMSRGGNCWDNAVAESFFATLKVELVNDAHWESRTEGLAALRQYIEWYNRQRLHSTLGYRSPADFEASTAA